MVQIGADIGEIWRIGNEMLGARHGQKDVCALTCKFQPQVLSATFGSSAEKLQTWAPILRSHF